MSHFSVLVVTNRVPTEDHLSEILMPFHEFECTGHDAYIEEIDETQEALESYNNDTSSQIKSPDGVLHDPYGDEFYRDPTEAEIASAGPLGFGSVGTRDGYSYVSKDWGDGKGYRAKIKFTPKDWEEVEVPTKETKTFLEFVEDYYSYKPVELGQKPDLEKTHKYGYAMVNDDGSIKVVRRTNPNKHWDWWLLGGRYMGRLLAKPGAQGMTGRPGVFGNDPARQGGIDGCRKADLDLDAMKSAAMKERERYWQESVKRAKDMGFTGSEEELDALRRDFYRRKAEVTVLWEKIGGGVRLWDFMPKHIPEEIMKWSRAFVDFSDITTDKDIPIAEWIADAPPLTAWAVLKDGVWYESGSMGWWGTSTGDKDPDEWVREFEKLLNDTPDDHWFSVVDCHI